MEVSLRLLAALHHLSIRSMVGGLLHHHAKVNTTSILLEPSPNYQRQLYQEDLQGD